MFADFGYVSSSLSWADEVEQAFAPKPSVPAPAPGPAPVDTASDDMHMPAVQRTSAQSSIGLADEDDADTSDSEDELIAHSAACTCPLITAT